MGELINAGSADPAADSDLTTGQHDRRLDQLFASSQPLHSSAKNILGPLSLGDPTLPPRHASIPSGRTARLYCLVNKSLLNCTPSHPNYPLSLPHASAYTLNWDCIFLPTKIFPRFSATPLRFLRSRIVARHKEFTATQDKSTSHQNGHTQQDGHRRITSQCRGSTTH